MLVETLDTQSPVEALDVRIQHAGLSDSMKCSCNRCDRTSIRYAPAAVANLRRKREPLPELELDAPVAVDVRCREDRLEQCLGAARVEGLDVLEEPAHAGGERADRLLALPAAARAKL